MKFSVFDRICELGAMEHVLNIMFAWIFVEFIIRWYFLMERTQPIPWLFYEMDIFILLRFLFF